MCYRQFDPPTPLVGRFTRGRAAHPDQVRNRLRLVWQDRRVIAIAGVDVSLAEDKARAAIVVLRFPDLAPLGASLADAPLIFPYIPGLLAFREGPAVLAAWDALKLKPDLVMFDGQGIAHPRGIGMASQMGLWLERPTIGVAKLAAMRSAQWAGPESRRQRAPMRRRRTDEDHRDCPPHSAPRKALYVSPGHLIDLPKTVEFVLACTTRYRLPETIRWAHRAAGGERLPGGRAEKPDCSWRGVPNVPSPPCDRAVRCERRTTNEAVMKLSREPLAWGILLIFVGAFLLAQNLEVFGPLGASL